MSSTPCTSTTDMRHAWAEGLRISEAPPRDNLSVAARTSQIELLHTVSTYIRAGWRWLQHKRTEQLSSRRLRLTETVSLGEKRSVSIVQVDGAQFLIGCSTGSVQLLAVLDKQEARKPISSTERAS